MGNVAELIGHLIALRAEQRTGILAVRHGDTSTSIFLRAGEIVFADEAPRAETLGLMLVRQKKLTQAQYDTLASRLSDVNRIPGQLRFAELVAELGFMSMAEVVKALNDQARFRVMRIIQRHDELTWQFQPHMEAEMVFAPGTPGAALRSAVGVTPPTVEELVLDAVRWIDDDHKNELGLFVALGKKLGVSTEDRLSVVRRFGLSREETDLLAKLDGKRTLGEILSMSGSVDGPALLTALLLTNELGEVDGKAARPGRITSPRQPVQATQSAQHPVAAVPAPRPTAASAAPTPMQVPAVMRPSANAPTPMAVPAVTRPVPAPSSSAHTATTTPPRAAIPRDDVDDPGPQSVRPGWSGSRASGTHPAATPTQKPGAPTPKPASFAEGRNAEGRGPDSPSRPPIPPPPKPSRTFPAVSASHLPTAPPGPPISASRIPTAPPPTPVPPSVGRVPTAPPSSPGNAGPGSAGRIPAAPPSNPAPHSPSARTSAVMKALEAKRNPGSRPNMPAVAPHEVHAVAEKEFQTALAHFKAFRYADASPGFTRAAELLPQSSEYKLYARWNHILQKGAPMQVHDRGEAWRLALAAIAADPNSAFAHYVAGAVAQEDGQKTIAHRYLSRAVALDPQLVDAQRRLRIVDRREA